MFLLVISGKERLKSTNSPWSATEVHVWYIFYNPLPETDHQRLRGRAKLNSRDHIEGQREREGWAGHRWGPWNLSHSCYCWLVTDSIFFFSLSDFYGTISKPDLEVYEMKIGPIIFQVASGDISKEEADVIVNSTSKSFNLKSGTWLTEFWLVTVEPVK